MKVTLLIFFVSFIFILGVDEKSYSWKEQTHERHLTPMALDLVKFDDKNKVQECQKGIEQECNQRYYSEIWDNRYREFIEYGAHDEDFPCDELEIIQKYEKPLKYYGIYIPTIDFFRYGIMLHCRANNHYGHPLSISGLTDSPWVGLDDPDVHPLRWAKYNAEFHPKQEFDEGRYWKGYKKLKKKYNLTARDVDEGNMSWVKAIDRYGYTGSSKRLAYYTLGFVLHVLQDQGVPEHVHDDPHGASGYTGFEMWAYENWPNWRVNIEEKAKKLKTIKYQKIDDFFINLARIGYSINRYSGGRLIRKPPYIDLKSDLARMFKIEYFESNLYDHEQDIIIHGHLWYLNNHDGTPTMNSAVNPKMKWSPQKYAYNPLWTKGHDEGEWWPTSKEIPGKLNDEEGFYYIELSGDFPHKKFEATRNLYPKSFLPKPLRSVEDQCQGWRIENLDDFDKKERHLYTLIAKTVLPYAVKYSADSIKHYYDIVNHPPYVKEVRVYNSDGIPKYSGRWVDNERKITGKNIRRVKNRNLVKEIDEPVKPGIIRIDIYFSEPVTLESVKLGKQRLENIIQDFQNAAKWSCFHEITSEKESDKEIISIQAKDKNNHYLDKGGQLDKNPSSPARRKTIAFRTDSVKEPIHYKWENYENDSAKISSHIDTNHRIKIDRGKLKSIVVIATPDQVEPCEEIVFETKEGEYEFEDGEQKTMPLRKKEIERIVWSWEGPHKVLQKKQLVREDRPEKKLVGTVSVVRGDRPESKVKGIATVGRIIGGAVASVMPIPQTSPLFKVEDVSIDSKVMVGKAFQGRAVEFYCAGTNDPGYRPNADVWWESDSPEILECSSNGRCVGRSAGIARVSLFYREKGRKGTFITTRPVEVHESAVVPRPVEFDKKEESGQKSCRPLRDAYLKKFYAMVEHYKQKNRSSSNVAGFLGSYVSDVFVDRYCEHQNYIDCGKGLADEYYECLNTCNQQWQHEIKTGNMLRKCAGNCNQAASKRKKECLKIAQGEDRKGGFILSNEGETLPGDDIRGQNVQREKEKAGFVLSDEGETRSGDDIRRQAVQREDKEGEELCRKLKRSLSRATEENNIKKFRLLLRLQKAKECDFYQSALADLQDWERAEHREENCREIDAGLKRARDARDPNLFRYHLSQAKDCDFYQSASIFLRDWIEDCAQIDMDLKQASDDGDIERFRALISKANVCDFFEYATAFLRDWEMEQRQPWPGSGPQFGKCNDVKKAGSDYPEQHAIDLGQTSGTFLFEFQTFNIKDRLTLFYERRPLFDTGCAGTKNWKSAAIPYSGTSTEVIVSIQPNCAGQRGTKWEFVVRCPGY